MSRRIKLYTKKGDNGTTSLYDGSRVNKNSIIMDCLGLLDELNVAIGNLAWITKNNELRYIQKNIINISSILATPNKKGKKINEFSEEQIVILESKIDCLQQIAPPLTDFILPCTNLEDSASHFCRVLCRKAERNLLTLFEQEKYNDEKNIKIYMNRLSDFFFAFSRTLGKDIIAKNYS